MKKFLEMMSEDIKKENFSVKEMVVYGVVVPLVMISIMGVAGWMETTM